MEVVSNTVIHYMYMESSEQNRQMLSETSLDGIISGIGFRGGRPEYVLRIVSVLGSPALKSTNWNTGPSRLIMSKSNRYITLCVSTYLSGTFIICQLSGF